MFSKILRELRIDNDLSQKDLANILGISPSTVAMYEQGRRTPDNEMLTKIADYFKVPVDYLLGRTKQKKIDLSLQIHEIKSILEKQYEMDNVNIESIKQAIEFIKIFYEKGIDFNALPLDEINNMADLYLLARKIKKD